MKNFFSNKIIYPFIILAFFTTKGFGQTKILLTGDSIVKGDTGSDPIGGFRDDLDNLLTGAGIDFDFVGGEVDGTGFDAQHEGYNSWTSDSINVHINEWLTNFNPDAVLIHVGTNDISLGVPNTTIIANIESIVDKIVAYNSAAKIYLSSLIPRVDEKDNITDSLNGLIENLVSQKKNEGVDIIFKDPNSEDINEAFKSNPNWQVDYMSNGLHPNNLGYNIMAQVYFEIITFDPDADLEEKDTFDDPAQFAQNWNDGSEFQLISGELVNTATDNDWEHLAIFTKHTNPTEVSLIWGATVDADGISNSAFGLRLDGTTNTANGYFVRYKTSTNRVELWELFLGAPNSLIDAITASSSVPVAEDTFKVVINTDETGHRFRCYVNNEPVGGRPLIDQDKLQDPGTWYSGLILRGNNNNNIDEFIFKRFSDTVPPAAITDLQVVSCTGNSVFLSWTATGDDGLTGQAAEYDLRYSTSTITESNFPSLPKASGVPSPAFSGTIQKFSVAGLGPNITYFFAMKVKDEIGNTSGLSNVTSGTTLNLSQTIDDFERTNLGNNWTASSEYQINNGELENTSMDNSFAHLAVFNSVINPLEVSLQYGLNVLQENLGDMALALMVNEASTTANGYFARRKGTNIELWELVNGDVNSNNQIAGRGGNITSVQPGDVFKVVVRSDDNGHHFDFFINDQFDGSLTDPFKQQGNSELQYAGVILRGRGGSINNIDNFTLSATATTPTSIQIVGGDNQQGPVGKPLPNPLVVRIEDEYGNPVPGTSVDFTATGGNGSLEPVSTFVTIFREAEDGDLTSPMQVASDGDASGGEFIYVPNNGGLGGEATFVFDVPSSGDYVIWGRALTPSGSDDSFYFSMDGEPSENSDDNTWDVFQSDIQTDWTWDQISKRGSGTSENPENDPFIFFSLSAGPHTLKIIQREDGVKLDKLLITNNLSFVPQGLGEEDQFFTDAAGEAKAIFTLGTTAGINSVEASLPGSPTIPPRTFTATGIVDSAATIQKTGGDGQSGNAGDSLPASLEVTLYDQYNNRVPNVDVIFTVIQGGGTLSNSQSVDTVNTNAVGKASTILTLGSENATNLVEATSAGLDTVVFTEYVTSGIPSILVYVSGLPQAGLVGESLNEPFKVKVTDNSDNPMSGHIVHFEVMTGGGTLDGPSDTSKDVPTDDDGIAEVTLTLGSNPGTNRVEASAINNEGHLENSPIPFEVTAGIVSDLEKVSGDSLHGVVKTPLGEPFKVRVKDSFDNPVANFDVTFTVELGGGTLDGLSATIKTVQTDSNGIAQVTLTLGPTVGDFNNVVEASAEIDGTPLAGSPVIFIASAEVSLPANLVVEGGSGQEGVVGNPLLHPFEVKVTDTHGNPIIGHSVTFTVIAGGGSFDGRTDTTVTTDANGIAQIRLTLGLTAGESNNIVEAKSSYDGNPLEGSPQTFTASARSSDATDLEYVGGDGQEETVGQPLDIPFQVMTKDSLGNPVDGHPVTFEVIAGGGTLDGDADTVKVVPTNDDGIAQVVLTLGLQAGTDNNVVEAKASDGVHDLDGSPITFTASATPGLPDSTGSAVVVVPDTVDADGTTQATITVTLKDIGGNPVPGKAVIVSATGSNNNLQQPLNLTNSDGQTWGYISSTKAEVKIISARDVTDGIDLVNTANVLFVPLAAHNIALENGNDQTGNIGTVSANPLVVKVTDVNGNPIPNFNVEFAITEGNGSFVEAQPVHTGASGYASVQLILDQAPGMNRVEARAPGLEGSPVKFIATGIETIATDIAPVSGDGQTGIAGRMLGQPLVVKVTDADQRPVWGYPVTFEVVEEGGGVVTDTVKATNAYGYASTYFTLDKLAGENEVVAVASELSGSPVSFTLYSEAGAAAMIKLDSGDGQQGSVNSTLQNPVVVEVTDMHGNPVENVEVNFAIVDGDATIGESQPRVTDQNGKASTTVNLGTNGGPISIEATSAALEGSPIVFTATITSGTAANMSIESGNDQTGTVGRELVFPLEVLVTDAYDNPVEGVSITFVVTEGVGSLVDGQSVTTDENGIASNGWILGPSPGSNEAMVIKTGLNGSPLIFTATGETNSYPLFAEKNDTTVQEGQLLVFSVAATDDDGDQLTYGVRNLPAGTTFDSTGTQEFRWSPSPSQVGKHTVRFVVADNNGGFDVEDVVITVRTILGITDYSPLDEWLTVSWSEQDTIAFSVQAVGCPLSYRWINYWGDDSLVVSTTDMYILRAENNTAESHTVKVEVSDGDAVVFHQWYVSVETPVQLVSFIAEVGQYKGVKLSWETKVEKNNVGFNILRSTCRNGHYRKVNNEIVPANETKKYSFMDGTVKAGAVYYYKLEDIDFKGYKTQHDPIRVEVPRPTEYQLSQNYPNPFPGRTGNPETKINYKLSKSGRVSIRIYNLLGQQVRMLVDGYKEAGYYTISWDGRDSYGGEVPSGVYYYQIRAGDFVQTKRMVLLK